MTLQEFYSLTLMEINTITQEQINQYEQEHLHDPEEGEVLLGEIPEHHRKLFILSWHYLQTFRTFQKDVLKGMLGGNKLPSPEDMKASLLGHEHAQLLRDMFMYLLRNTLNISYAEFTICKGWKVYADPNLFTNKLTAFLTGMTKEIKHEHGSRSCEGGCTNESPKDDTPPAGDAGKE